MTIYDLPYRPCAGIMMLNKKGQVFVGRRIDTRIAKWQMPQGGIDEGEEPIDAALRELKEEVGTNNVEMLAESKDWHSYDIPDYLLGKLWGGKYKGQRQKWFAVRFLGDDSEINIETKYPEFCEWKWVDAEELPDIIVSFKQELYRIILDEFKVIIKGS